MRYSTGAIILHWLIAVPIILNALLAVYMNSLPPLERPPLIMVHAATGLTVLALSVARIGWRLTHTPPPAPSWLKPWERHLANSVHAAFYLLIVALPLIGWCMASARGRTVSIFGLFDVRPLPLPAEAAPTFAGMHVTMGYLMIALVALHIGGVLKHRFIDRDHVFARMWFGGRRPQADRERM